MKLRDLVAKLQSKPDQDEEVEYVVYQKKDEAIVCMLLTGVNAPKIINALSGRPKK